MTRVEDAQIKRFRSELSSSPGALDALNVLESCGENLEAGITKLANRCGKDSTLVLSLVDEQYQKLVCDNEFTRMALPPTLGLIANYLAKSHLPEPLSEELAIIVAIYTELGLKGYYKRK